MANRVYKEFPQVTNPQLLDIFHKIGNTMTIGGVLLQGDGESVLFMLPEGYMQTEEQVIQPTLAEWEAILAQSDNPTIFEQDISGAMKAVARKAAYAISGGVQQKVWHRDGYKCMYCGRNIGQGVTLSIDHFMPIVLGGENRPSNYLTACRQCNKKKGDIDPQAWCTAIGRDFSYYMAYLETTK